MGKELAILVVCGRHRYKASEGQLSGEEVAIATLGSAIGSIILFRYFSNTLEFRCTGSFDGDEETIMNAILAPVEDKIYFAGEALSLEHQSTVHGACESAYQAIESMLSA